MSAEHAGSLALGLSYAWRCTVCGGKSRMVILKGRLYAKT